MTRKEIIDGLKFTVDMFLFDPSTGETFTEPRNDMDKTTIDACKGAIELLEQTDRDLISRQKAIDTIDTLYLDGDSVVSYLANANGDTLIGKYQVITALDDLPSVTLQSKWIPVSKGLPNFNDTVLASAYYDDKSTRPIIIKYSGEKFWLDGTIKAWMPLPEPYKAESEKK